MPSPLIVSNLFFSYDSMSTPLFEGLSVSFPPGWTALSGANGSGKSTLVALLSGALVPDSGFVSPLRVETCAQDMEALPPFFSDPTVMNDPESLAIIARFGIDDSWPWRWDTLSGGERRRCMIAGALLSRPDALILDEPTNHVDAGAVSLLAAALGEFKGIGIVVSHDIAFIDALCSHTLTLRRASGSVRASWHDARPSLSFLEDERDAERARAARDEERQRLEGLGARYREAGAQVARAKRSASKRDLEPKDSSGRAAVNLARLSGKDASSAGKQARLAGEMDRLRARLDSIDAIGLRKTGAALTGSRSRRDRLFSLPEGTLPIADGAIELAHPGLTILPDSRIAVMGPNGSGKSSLVARVLSSLDLPQGRTFALKQELSAEERRAARRRLLSLSEGERGSALSFVYRLGSEPESLLETECPSPGETRKLLLALAMLAGPELLVLDEPTNHLDSLSSGLLADALGGFAGAVLLVTHDAAFADRLGCARWNVSRVESRATLKVG